MSISLATMGKFQGPPLIIEEVVAICEPQSTSFDVGSLHLSGLIDMKEGVTVIPGMATDYQPDKIDVGEYLPDKVIVTKTLPILKTLPLPGNL